LLKKYLSSYQNRYLKDYSFIRHTQTTSLDNVKSHIFERQVKIVVGEAQVLSDFTLPGGGKVCFSILKTFLFLPLGNRKRKKMESSSIKNGFEVIISVFF
jgi:hypothetical protein